MTDLEDAERKALFILFTQNQIDSAALESAKQLNSDYDAHIPDHLLEPAFEKWASEGLAKTSRTAGTLRIRLRRDAFSDAYRRVLDLFDASSITIYPDMREIVSDIAPTNDIPVKDGWKWFTTAPDRGAERPAIYAHNQTMIPATPTSHLRLGPVNWTKWGTILTGIGIVVAIVLWKYS